MNDNILLTNAVFEPHFYKDKAFPFIFHRNRMERPGIYNQHKNIELLYIQEGVGQIRIGAKVHRVRGGDMAVIDCYAPHQVIPEGKMVVCCIIPDYNFCKSNNIEMSKLHFSPVVHSEWLIERMAGIVEECLVRPRRKFKYACLKYMVLEILVYLCRNHSAPRQKPFAEEGTPFERVRLGIEFIKENLDKKISLEEVAESAGTSKYYFLRLFKKVTGYTVNHYINYLRCEYARELLESGKYTAREVAEQCSFDNHSYFTSVFKKYQGILPSDVLK